MAAQPLRRPVHALVLALALVIALALVATACTVDSGAPLGGPATTPAPLDGQHPDGQPGGGQPATGPPTMLMWGRGGLPDDLPGRARALPGVLAVRELQSDTLGLQALVRPDGAAGRTVPDGFQYPVQVTAIDPEQWRGHWMLATHAELLDQLRPGTAMITPSVAHLGAAPTGVAVADLVDAVQLVDAPPLAVIGELPPGVFGSAEVVVHAMDATAALLQRGPTIVVEHDADDDAGRAELAAALAALAPEDRPARVVDTADPDLRRDAPLVLSLADTKEQFGWFAYRPRDGVRDIVIEEAWVDRHIVLAEVPIIGSVRCHRAILDDLRRALEQLQLEGLDGEIDPAQYAGCFAPRRISPERAALSHHAWGIALDINVDLALPGGGAPPSDRVVEVFGLHGFRWGGDFIVPDNHHFEWVGGRVARAPASDGGT